MTNPTEEAIQPTWSHFIIWTHIATVGQRVCWWVDQDMGGTLKAGGHFYAAENADFGPAGLEALGNPNAPSKYISPDDERDLAAIKAQSQGVGL